MRDPSSKLKSQEELDRADPPRVPPVATGTEPDERPQLQQESEQNQLEYYAIHGYCPSEKDIGVLSGTIIRDLKKATKNVSGKCIDSKTNGENVVGLEGTIHKVFFLFTTRSVVGTVTYALDLKEAFHTPEGSAVRWEGKRTLPSGREDKYVCYTLPLANKRLALNPAQYL